VEWFSGVKYLWKAFVTGVRRARWRELLACMVWCVCTVVFVTTTTNNVRLYFYNFYKKRKKLRGSIGRVYLSQILHNLVPHNLLSQNTLKNLLVFLLVLVTGHSHLPRSIKNTKISRANYIKQTIILSLSLDLPYSQINVVEKLRYYAWIPFPLASLQYVTLLSLIMVMVRAN
jgi:hypothetical protein